MIERNDLSPDGFCLNRWRLCSVQQVEDVKRLIKTLAIWISSIITAVALA